jgi:hypothetical protein
LGRSQNWKGVKRRRMSKASQPRPSAAVRRPLHDDEADFLEVLDKALGDDRR